MERNYHITIRTDGRPALNDQELSKAIIEAIMKKDKEAERYGPAIAGYMVTVDHKKMF